MSHGTTDPLGENIPIVHTCTSHVPVASGASLTAAGAGGFLGRGDQLTAPPQPTCGNAGFSIEVTPADGPQPPTGPTDAAPSPGSSPSPTGPAAPGHGPGAPLCPVATDRTPPRVTLSVRRRRGRYLVTLSATDRAGIRRLEYRLTTKGAFHRYRQPLRLRRKQLTAVRVHATDKAGNTTSSARANECNLTSGGAPAVQGSRG